LTPPAAEQAAPQDWEQIWEQNSAKLAQISATARTRRYS
jgi:hypothetical protein